uniref:(northern house mosquito) hypothetical protein n=1 Tax=Culex pipiens TaxID=7175 RepID=A0A8D8DCX4_CULPI
MRRLRGAGEDFVRSTTPELTRQLLAAFHQLPGGLGCPHEGILVDLLLCLNNFFHGLFLFRRRRRFCHAARLLLHDQLLTSDQTLTKQLMAGAYPAGRTVFQHHLVETHSSKLLHARLISLFTVKSR